MKRSDLKNIIMECIYDVMNSNNVFQEQKIDDMELYKRHRTIIKYIIKAQINSDSGKGITGTVLKNSKDDNHVGDYDNGYKYKTQLIAEAIKHIDRTPKCGITYYVGDNDNPRFKSMIVYFVVRAINNKKYQISFHVPSFEKYSAGYDVIESRFSKGRKIRWDKKSSSDNVGELAELYHFGRAAEYKYIGKNKYGCEMYATDRKNWPKEWDTDNSVENAEKLKSILYADERKEK